MARKTVERPYFSLIDAHPPLHLRAWHHDWMSKFNFCTWYSRFWLSALLNNAHNSTPGSAIPSFALLPWLHYNSFNGKWHAHVSNPTSLLGQWLGPNELSLLQQCFWTAAKEGTYLSKVVGIFCSRVVLLNADFFFSSISISSITVGNGNTGSFHLKQLIGVVY